MEKKQSEWQNKSWSWAVKRLKTGFKTKNIPERPKVGIGKVDLELPAVEV